ncbi:hypothetical protein DFS34DRAFT_256569 [Phlyctochytrium arcticum]|nr:hypothetical protein DFS34DRAFT_256569 [Phlyctochytrium arcticum]
MASTPESPQPQRITTNRTLTIARHADIVNTPKWKQKEIAALRNGPRASVYMINKDQYLGEWKDGLKHGKGIYTYAQTGAVYEGEWVKDLRNGLGTYSLPKPIEQRKTSSKQPVLPSLGSLKASASSKPSSGSLNPRPMRKVYAGRWLDDLRHGHGTCFYDDGSVYDGNWEDDVREGWGRMNYAKDQSVYEGEWHAGMRHGHGVLVLASGDRYEGTFFNDMKEGAGRFIYRLKRQCYEGEWALDMPKCGTVRDLPPLAGREGQLPDARDWWPIPELKLQNPEEVLQTEKEGILQERLQRVTFHSGNELY